MLKIVGQSPPKSGLPPFCGDAGKRLARFFDLPLAVLRERAFLVNLYDRPRQRWDPNDARTAAADFYNASDHRDVILTVGRKVTDAFGVSDGWFTITELIDEDKRSVFFGSIPHPSARNRFWNDWANRYRAKLYLENIARVGGLVDSDDDGNVLFH